MENELPELHKHLLVDATLANPPTDPKVVEDWLRRLVEAVDMEIFIDPVAKYCDDPANAGVTGVVVITTSHSSVHFWSECEQPYAKFDLYSCKDFDVHNFLAIMEEFKPIKVSYTLIDRTGPFHQVLESAYFDYKEYRLNHEAGLRVLHTS